MTAPSRDEPDGTVGRPPDGGGGSRSPGASGPGAPGYEGEVTVGDEGAAAGTEAFPDPFGRPAPDSPAVEEGWERADPMAGEAPTG